MDLLKRIFNDLFTGKDGISHDLGKYSWAGSFIAVIAAGIWNAMHGVVLDLMHVAEALGAVAGVHGATLWAKKDTEPDTPINRSETEIKITKQVDSKDTIN